MYFQQIDRGGVNVPRLGVAQPARADDLFNLSLRGEGEGFQRRKFRIQILGDDIYALVRALRRQARGEQQLIVLGILQRTDGVRIFPLQPLDSGAGALFWGQHAISSF